MCVLVIHQHIRVYQWVCTPVPCVAVRTRADMDLYSPLWGARELHGSPKAPRAHASPRPPLLFLGSD